MDGLLSTEARLWRFAAASALGTSHVKCSMPCQDRIACVALPDGTLVAVVSDGAGSAMMAERGAEIVVATAIKHLSEATDNGRLDFPLILQEAAFKSRTAVLMEAENQGLEPRAFASTLLAAVVSPSGGGAMQIGDGVIVVSDDNGQEWSWVFWPQHGEYVNTTRFLTDEDAADYLQIESFAGTVNDIALMTDGLEPLALNYESKSVHDPFFRGMFRPLLDSVGSGDIQPLSESLKSFLSSDRIAARTEDDVSIILATRRFQSP